MICLLLILYRISRLNHQHHNLRCSSLSTCNNYGTLSMINIFHMRLKYWWSWQNIFITPCSQTFIVVAISWVLLFSPNHQPQAPYEIKQRMGNSVFFTGTPAAAQVWCAINFTLIYYLCHSNNNAILLADRRHLAQQHLNEWMNQMRIHLSLSTNSQRKRLT